MITQFEDIAEAHLRFRNGCVANLRASRVSPDAERRMFVHDLNRQLTVDFGARTVRSVERCAALQKGTFRAQSLSAAKIGQLKGQVFTELLPVVEYSAPEANPLADELQDFMTAVRDRRVPRVSGWDACRAMEAAERIVQTIRRGSAWPRTQPESVPRRAA